MSSTPISLLERLRGNPDDGEAWRWFDDLYRPLLAGWLRRQRLPSVDVDDVVQDVFAAVVRELPGFRYEPQRGRFRSWLRTILVHRVQEYRRRRQAEPQALGDGLDALADPNSALAQQWDREHDRHVVSRHLDTVRHDFGPVAWQAFERRLAGEKASAIAAELGLTVNAVYLTTARILRRLRDEMAGLVGD